MITAIQRRHISRRIVLVVALFLLCVILLVLWDRSHQTQQRTTKSEENAGSTATQHEGITFDNAPDIDLAEVLRLANEERIKTGLAALVSDPALDMSASEKCADMVAKDYWSHVSPDGVDPWHWIAKYNTYATAGENLGYGFYSASGVVQGWMNSPEHKANILNTTYTNVGYAQCKYPVSSQFGYNTIVVQHFIKQR